jgi:hypothetical protein
MPSKRAPATELPAVAGRIDPASAVDSSAPVWTAEVDAEATPVDHVVLDRAVANWLLSIDAKDNAPPAAVPAATTRRRPRKTGKEKG